jgi:hypothetical protein
MIADGSDRGPVALPVFKTGRCLLVGRAGFDSQALPPRHKGAAGRCGTKVRHEGAARRCGTKVRHEGAARGCGTRVPPTRVHVRRRPQDWGRRGSKRLAREGRAISSSLLDQANISRAWALLRVFRSELDTLPLTKQFEHRSPHRAAVKEVFEAGLIPDEPEPLVDEESCDRSGRHTRILRFQAPEVVPGTAAPADTSGIRQ